MVNGCENKIERDIVVVDLDGTLIRGNTLHLFIKAAVGDAVRTHCYGFVLFALLMLVLRLLKLISHKRMKFAILRRVKITEPLQHRFVENVNSRRRESVEQLLDSYRKNNATIVLATAAADIYVPWIWMGEYVATATFDNPAREECRSTVKLAALRCKYPNFDQRLLAVFTDHYDDLALLGAGAPNIYLVAPSSQTQMTVSLANIKYIQLD
jgi:hypothetical protein